jgi:hypothetical protein
MHQNYDSYLHHQLMSPGNQSETIIVIEIFRNILTERVTGTTRRDTPTASIVWIRPQQITHGSFVWNFLNTIQGTNMIKSVNRWGETTMQAKNLKRMNFLEPNKVAEKPITEDILHVRSNLKKRAYLIFNQSSQGKIVKQIGKIFPNICISVFP